MSDLSGKNDVAEGSASSIGLSDAIYRLMQLLDQRFDRTACSGIRLAIAAAESAHAGQTRDDGSPYVAHPVRVALSLIEEFGVTRPELVVAALLHDVIEDSVDYDPERLAEEFGDEVAAIVVTLTKPERGERSRDQVNAIYFSRLREASDDCKLIKLADKLDNVRDSSTSLNAERRARTVNEARDFYLPLARSHASESMRERAIRLLNGGIDSLES